LIPLGKLKRLLCLAFFMQSLLFPQRYGMAVGLLMMQPGAEFAGTGAMVARADNSLISYYYPAGLTFLKNSHISLSHISKYFWWWGESAHNSLSFSHQLSVMSAIGGNVMYFYHPNFYYNSFKDEYWTIALNYATMLSSSSSIGFGLKLLRPT